MKISILMAAILALLGMIGMFLGGAGGMLLALLLGGVMNIWVYWNSDKMVLKMYNALQGYADSVPLFYAIGQELVERVARLNAMAKHLD